MLKLLQWLQLLLIGRLVIGLHTQKTRVAHWKHKLSVGTNKTPHHPIQHSKSILLNTFYKTLSITTSTSAFFISKQQVQAIGSLHEFKSSPVIFQDISFNVVNTYDSSDFFTATFPDLCKIVRNTMSGNKNTTVIGFGPDAYETSKTFYPGVSSFYEYGGHATLTFESEELKDDTFAIYERGNGLQYIKFGAENFRISKAIERGTCVCSFMV
jgi:hypothetical protein